MDGLLKIGMLQADVAWLDVDANLATLEECFYDQIIGKGYDLVLLPEMFSTGFGKQVVQYAEFMDGKTHKWLRNMASLANALVLGSVPVRQDGNTYNRLLCVYPDGATVPYDKKHLFGYGGESETFSSGKERVVLEYKGFKIRPMVCYDLRFPVWARHTVAYGYDVLVYVANWPSARQYAWEHLLKARAIENQAYVLGCNRIGADGNGLEYRGGSLAIDTQGYVIGEESAGLVSAVLDLEKLRAFRIQYPFLNDGDDFKLV